MIHCNTFYPSHFQPSRGVPTTILHVLLFYLSMQKGSVHHNLNYIFFPEGGVGQTQAWMPTYVSILHIPQMMSLKSDGGMILTGETEELGEKPVPVTLCPPQIPHGLTQAQTWASAVRGRRLTTWYSMSWINHNVLCTVIPSIPHLVHLFLSSSTFPSSLLSSTSHVWPLVGNGMPASFKNK
jgi:hypothetical protein